MDVALPDLPYVNINFTMPHELLPIFQRNRRLLHDLPALRAAAIQHWARARYGVRVLILVVQQSFGGLLNFHPHLHILVSAGGLRESGSHWIARLRFDKHELMQVWRAGAFAGPLGDGVGILQPGWSLLGTATGEPESLAGVSDWGELRESAERHASWRAGVFDYLH